MHDRFIAPVCEHLVGKSCSKLNVKCMELKWFSGKSVGECEVRKPASYITSGVPARPGRPVKVKRYCHGEIPTEDNSGRLDDISVIHDGWQPEAVHPDDVIPPPKSKCFSYDVDEEIQHLIAADPCPIETRYPNETEYIADIDGEHANIYKNDVPVEQYSPENGMKRAPGKVPHYTNDE